MEQRRPATIKLNARDTVIVALEALPPGAVVEEGVICAASIPAGHKIAVQPMEPGDPVRKYGQTIGFATLPIQPGDHVHTHNIEVKDFVRDYAIGAEVKPTQFVAEKDRATFQGIVRADGRVATRNYIGVLSSVNCSASVARFIAEAVPAELLAKYPNVDGVVGLGHGTGCGMAGSGEGFEYLQRVLAGYAKHPNFAGVLLVGLGCETNQIDLLMDRSKLFEGPFFHAYNIQNTGGTRGAILRGVEAIEKMLPEANKVRREPLPASYLTLGLECGGSDAYSGITANPALGAAADLLVRHGGTAILSETPEIYGAEHLLTRRAVSREVGEKLIDRIKWWEQYTRKLGADINNNPSPGNKAGGLTTILEKSLGAASKGGSTNLMDVYGFAEPVTAKGFVFMDTPGYDTVSVTGMVAGGANIVCFTTGRGTVCGFKPVPTIKIATNSEMYERLEDDMDVNCGSVVTEGKSVRELGALIFRRILDAASGEKTKSEILGFGDSEFVPWQIGAVL